jgi:tetratricopeptide (TPR) repeat protein
MLTQLIIEASHVSLVCAEVGFSHRRPLEVAELSDIVGRYALAREARVEGNEAALLALGRELYRWLDGKEGWLSELRRQLTPPLILEIQAEMHPDAGARTVLQAPWELLADDGGYLAVDTLLRFAPARRLGPAQAAAKPDDYRLGIAFMAAAPEGVAELDYEAEESAILRAAREGVDLYVEDSGDPEELGYRLSALEAPLPVLHLSCHGHNAWRVNGQLQPVLMLENPQGDRRPTTAADLLDALGSYKPRLLMLSACLSAAVGEPGNTELVADSLASALVRAGLPAVLGWDGSVADVAATRFAQELYERLGQRQPIAEAAAGARRALLSATAASGGTGDKNRMEGSGLGELSAQEKILRRRDWHLARVWLGPGGGGALVGGALKRSLLRPDHEYKQVLKVKGDARLVVADPAMFVGRRRELQRGLRVLAGGDFAGVLLHGMGRLGKSSLAARLASRRRDLTLAVVYGAYDALSILEAIGEALKDHPAARELLRQGRDKVRSEPVALEEVLVDLLAGPCRQGAIGKPLLLLIDDLEQVLETSGTDGRRVRTAERVALRAVLRAFDPALSESRLLITSRFPFSLVDDGEELAAKLFPLQLPPMREITRRKLLRRQVDAARTRPGPGMALDDKTIDERLPLRERALQAARGNPGLQDLLEDRLVLRRALPQARVEAALKQIEAYLSGGALPKDEEVREFLQNLALDQLLEEAGAAGQALLRASLLFEAPVPEAMLAALAAEVGGAPDKLRELGLFDPYRDLVDREVTALAINGLVAGRLTALSDAERSGFAPISLVALFEAWGGADGGARRPYAADIELTRLGLLAQNAEVVDCCAADAVRGLERYGHPTEAADVGQAAIAAIAAGGREPTLTLLARTAAALGTIGEGAAASEVLSKGEARLEESTATAGLDSTELAPFLFELGDWRVMLGELDRAQEAFARLCGIAAAGHDEQMLAFARGRIADILYQRSELDEALRIHREEELPVYTRLGAVREIAVTQGKIADILEQRGELDEALRIHREEQLPVYTRLGDVHGIAIAHGRIADILWLRGEPDEALRIYQKEVLPSFTRLGAVRDIAITQSKIADILEQRGELDEALRIRREEQLPVFTRLGDMREITVTQGKVADILYRRGELDEALRIYRKEALPSFTRLGAVREIAVTQGRIARILAQKGDLAGALEIQVERLATNRALKDSGEIAAALWDISQIEREQQKFDEAVLRLVEAWQIFTQMDQAEGVAVVGRALGQLAALAGDKDKALEILRRSAAAYRKLGREGEARRVEQLIAQIS